MILKKRKKANIDIARIITTDESKEGARMTIERYWYFLKAKQCGGAKMWAPLYFLPGIALDIHNDDPVSSRDEEVLCLLHMTAEKTV